MDYAIRGEDIAIIGLAGRFPGANSIDEFWKNLCAGSETIHQFNDEELQHAGVDANIYSKNNYVKAKGIIDHIEDFDADFFGLSPLEAKILDPQHRLFLLCAWELFENAGYTLQDRNRIGVFASTGMSFYLLKQILTNPSILQDANEYQLLLSNDKDFLATRLSYLFNLQGPSVNLQTGCSSSLVCVHYACQSILNGECDMAIAGGVSLSVPQQQGYLYQKEMIGSPDGHCYAFDSRAQGTVKSNGLGLILLKPLDAAIKDNNHIYAVIKGTAVNNDGANKVGYTAPSVNQQAAAIKEALQMAEIDLNHVEYIETHGTGTLLGDPIEIAALSKVFAASANNKNTCALASLKTNIGHLDVAAGIAGLIKAALAVYHGKIPASLNFSQLNPKINLENTPFYVNTVLKEWHPTSHYRTAGVSAFGVGGTNVHVVLQQAPSSYQLAKQDKANLLLFSAKSPTSLVGNIKKMAAYLGSQPEINLSNVAYTLQHGRTSMPYKMAYVIKQSHDLQEKLNLLQIENIQLTVNKPHIVFMFSGQGSQYPGMGASLYATEPVFKQALDECLAALKPYMTKDLRSVLFPKQIDASTHEALKQTELTQPALFAIEYALAQFYLSCGVKPSAVLGHSIGEYTAAVIAGVFTLTDAAKIIAKRGQLIQKLPGGKMLAAYTDVTTIRNLLIDKVDIALLNAPNVTVVAGPQHAIEAFAATLDQYAIRYQLLHTSHAFHSAMLDGALEEFTHVVSSIEKYPPTLPIASNVTGEWLTEEQAMSVNYWVDQLRHTVKFTHCVSTIEKKFSPYFIEVGPGRTLQQLIYQQGIKKAFHSLPQANEPEENSVGFLHTLAELWKLGLPINQSSLGNLIPLPTYAWDLKRYWIDAIQPTVKEKPAVLAPIFHLKTNLKEEVRHLWASILGLESIGDGDHFFNLGGTSFTAIQLINRLPNHLQTEINVVHVYQYPIFNHFIQFLHSLNKINEITEENSEFELFAAEGEL